MSDGNAIFNLPVTKSWLRQLITPLTLCCYSSSRVIQELLEVVFDYKISIGSIHNIVQEAIGQTQVINDKGDFPSIKVGALDEIFQSDISVLV